MNHLLFPLVTLAVIAQGMFAGFLVYQVGHTDGIEAAGKTYKTYKGIPTGEDSRLGPDATRGIHKGLEALSDWSELAENDFKDGEKNEQ